MIKDFLRIISFIKTYSLFVVASFICNLLYSLFSVFTLGMIVPFISILFGIVEPVVNKPTFHLSLTVFFKLCLIILLQ